MSRNSQMGAPGWTPPGVRVRQARVASGLSLREVARRVGVSAATLSHVETGRVSLTVERLEVIAEVLGVDAADIVASRVSSRKGRAVRCSAPTVPVAGEWRDYRPMPLTPVLDAALAEFLAVGYHGTSMRLIAARSGLPASSIYRWFPGKQELLLRILELTMTDLEWRADAAVLQGDTAVGRFALAVENLALFHTHRHRFGFIGASEVRALEPRNRAAIAMRRNRQQSRVDEYVYAAVRLGEFDVAHPDDASRAVVTMCTALSSWWQPGGRRSAEEIAAEYVEYALAVMGYRRGGAGVRRS